MRRGKRHEFSIDGQTVWLDSLNEAIALDRFVNQYGFSGKWDRPQFGVMHGGKQYTPDFELAVQDGSFTSRAIVEVKEYKRDCLKATRQRMCTIARHYNTKHVFLYAVKKDEWFGIDADTTELIPCLAPLPGNTPVAQLYKPMRFKTTNYYGRTYYQSYMDSFLSPLQTKPEKRHRK